MNVKRNSIQNLLLDCRTVESTLKSNWKRRNEIAPCLAGRGHMLIESCDGFRARLQLEHWPTARSGLPFEPPPPPHSYQESFARHCTLSSSRRRLRYVSSLSCIPFIHRFSSNVTSCKALGSELPEKPSDVQGEQILGRLGL